MCPAKNEEKILISQVCARSTSQKQKSKGILLRSTLTLRQKRIGVWLAARATASIAMAASADP
jgi:hypothetical protein